MRGKLSSETRWLWGWCPWRLLLLLLLLLLLFLPVARSCMKCELIQPWTLAISSTRAKAFVALPKGHNLAVLNPLVPHDVDCPMLNAHAHVHTQDLLCSPSLLESREPVGSVRPFFFPPRPWTCLLGLRSAVATYDTYVHLLSVQELGV